MSYLETLSLIKDSQDDFQNNRSCLLSLLAFYNDLFSVHDATELLGVVCLDFPKASDEILLYQTKKLGI